ncbi:hypothetical protein RHMOL_Rhmol07G0188800 [Rhododendron molle]|uniref:Uncharacterized protein n=1 Tax=Rhododendron molle TaxID=49168 RepID=A0ACC0N2X9_RHOML|nr:hypothetical protein RHMOL_Rhmol07G0188800 [Rhododendron molle]
MTLVQGLVDLFTSATSNPNLGLNADGAIVKEPPQFYHPPAVGIEPCSKVKLSGMFKGLAAFHDTRTHSKEDAGSLSAGGAERKDAHIDEVQPSAKRMCSIDSAALYNGEVGKSSTDSRPGCRTPPRFLNHFLTLLSSVYEKLLEAGFIKLLLPIPLPRTFFASHDPNGYGVLHQMPSHPIQDLIDIQMIQIKISKGNQ